jgi:hypothetical protein
MSTGERLIKLSGFASAGVAAAALVMVALGVSQRVVAPTVLVAFVVAIPGLLFAVRQAFRSTR